MKRLCSNVYDGENYLMDNQITNFEDALEKEMMGSSEHTLDNKFRLIIPSRLRKGLGEKFVMCRGMDNNIDVYPAAEWAKLCEKLNALPKSNKAARQYASFFTSSGDLCQIDSQNRVVINAALREWAGIDNKVCFVGKGATAQIWSVDRWNEYNDYDESIDINALADEMYTNFGF